MMMDQHGDNNNINVTTKESLWVEKYRPRTIQDTVLPKNLKTVFQKFVDDKNVPNLLLYGKAGTGKTTVARAMLEEIGCDYIIINGSMKGNIDTLRTEIANYASSMALGGGRKYVILDESDYLNPNSTQPALRNFMEEFSSNCGFILTCNFKGRIIAPLHSRCSLVDFTIPKQESAGLAAEFYKRTLNILTEENVDFDKKAVAKLIETHYPDWRRILNELQRYSATGRIDSQILVNLNEDNFKKLIQNLKQKDFSGMREWIAVNSDIDANTIFRQLYDSASTHLKSESIPTLVVLLGEYQYKSAHVADQEVNLAALLTEVMADCDFK